MIIIGIEEDLQHVASVVGVTDAQIDSFASYESIKDKVDSYSTAPINFDIGYGEYTSDGSDAVKLVVITVQEFDEVPAMCCRDGSSGKGVLRDGDIYSRLKKGKPASARITVTELSEIINLAVAKKFALHSATGLHAAVLAELRENISAFHRFWDRLEQQRNPINRGIEQAFIEATIPSWERSAWNSASASLHLILGEEQITAIRALYSYLGSLSLLQNEIHLATEGIIKSGHFTADLAARGIYNSSGDVSSQEIARLNRKKGTCWVELIDGKRSMESNWKFIQDIASPSRMDHMNGGPA